MPRLTHAERKARAVDRAEALGHPVCFYEWCDSPPESIDCMMCNAHAEDARQRRKASKRQLKRARRSQVSWL